MSNDKFEIISSIEKHVSGKERSIGNMLDDRDDRNNDTSGGLLPHSPEQLVWPPCTHELLSSASLLLFHHLLAPLVSLSSVTLFFFLLLASPRPPKLPSFSRLYLGCHLILGHCQIASIASYSVKGL